MSSKRQRELARRRVERQSVRRAELAQKQRDRRKVTWSVFGGVLALLLVVFVGAKLVGDDDKAAVGAPPGECAYTPVSGEGEDVGVPPADGFDKKPRTATVKLNSGTLVFETFSGKAPCTVNSLVHLASKSFFDKTKCHRLATAGPFVVQCGDPTGIGSGGPGYQLAEENLEGATYPRGTVAMAKSSAPGTTGSQFFLVYKDTPLPPEYTPFGKITRGLGVLDKIAKEGTKDGSGDGAPKNEVTIESLTVKSG